MGKCLKAVLLTLCVVALSGWGKEALKPARLLVELPDYCNTPDGMCLLPDNSFLVSMPNFNDEKSPPLMMRITPDNKAEKFYEFPNPYPGFPEKLARIRPMGVSRDPATGNLFLADMQYMLDKDQKSRMWKLVVKNGKVEKMVLVASGLNVANGTAVHNGYVYITESVLEEGFNPSLKSALMRFKLDEENVTLKTPLKDDPHVIATFDSYRQNWGFGADGLAFDGKGNLFVGLFSDGVMYRVKFDKQGKVESNKICASAPGRLTNCDGMACDPRTSKLYVADSGNNAIQVIDGDKVETLAANEDTLDKKTGELDQPCEAMLRGNTIVVSNMDWPFPGFKNSKHQQPATISVIQLDKK
ncbi:MAG: SMP-30/gluconolactonase/LRE family protein [Planctomycetota bacterium]|nr:SMP-30/gluconolactonase/LRE family protein [Planctomycetota bacterium]